MTSDEMQTEAVAQRDAKAELLVTLALDEPQMDREALRYRIWLALGESWRHGANTARQQIREKLRL